MQDQGSNTVSFSPSFSSYSSNHHLADVAAQVAGEGNDFSEEENLFTCLPRNGNDDVEEDSGSSTDDEDDDFEFVLVRANPDGTNETTYPIFPLFNRDLLSDNQREDRDVIRLPLKKLFIDDRDPPSSSSSEADELDGVSPGTYCVWTPSKSSKSPSSQSPLASPSRCKKSNSTGSSSSTTKQQRWRLRDLLHLKRSSSDGKESFIFLNRDHNNNNSKKKEEKTEKGKKEAAAKGKGKGKGAAASAHEVFYVRNKALKGGDKRRSYLPYRQGLVGFFASNVNGLGRNFAPF